MNVNGPVAISTESVRFLLEMSRRRARHYLSCLMAILVFRSRGFLEDASRVANDVLILGIQFAVIRSEQRGHDFFGRAESSLQTWHTCVA